MPGEGEDPPAAGRGRLAAALAGRARASMDSVAGTTGLRLVGFEPLTEVMGASVVPLSYVNCACGTSGRTPLRATPTLVTGRHRGGYAPYGNAVQAAWETALSRLLAETSAVGGDGVVGLGWSRRPVPGPGGNEEFLLLGRAVRARGDVRPRRPFSTDLSGGRFAALVRAGWIPSSWTITPAVGVRHEDWQTRRGVRVWAGNLEVAGFTELVHDTRTATRDQFARALRRLGSETSIVSDIALRTWMESGAACTRTCRTRAAPERGISSTWL